jgi:DNA-binding NtrC family response regulator
MMAPPPSNRSRFIITPLTAPDRGRDLMPSLLLVDDDQTLLNVLLELFSGEHQCDAAATAEEGFELLGANGYDLVVTDISMPGMSGETLLGYIKANSPSTPVIFISGSKDRELARRLRVKGAASFLSKPFNLAEIMQTVERALQGRRS